MDFRSPSPASSATRVLSTTDGRWALVSTSLTALIAGTIAWLAMGTTPPLKPALSPRSQTTFLPYQLFQRLAGSSGSLASLAPLPQATKPTAPVVQQQTESEQDAAPTIETRTITMDRGDTLAGALEDAGISAEDANAAVAALGKVYNSRNLRAGQPFGLTYETKPQSVDIPATASDDGDTVADTAGTAAQAPIAKLISIAFSPSVEHEINIARDDSGVFGATDTVKKLEAHIHRAGVTIEGSLYLSAMRAGIPADVVVEMIHMFSYEVDFQRDIRPGDTFEVFYDYYYTPDGQPARNGNVKFATMHLRGRTLTLYRWQPDANEPADYFDAHGQSAKSMLMKTPVDGARITSGFGMRFHPILGYTRMHKGVDFGVPWGTPVMAAGGGTIEEAHWKGGYGNFVMINHGNGYETAYGHLSRYAPGIHPGSHVHQGQVVAFSGSTGESTGPHLHYEIRIHHTQVNPQTVKVARGRILAGRELREYQIQRLHTDALIAAMPLETKVADISTDLRQAKLK
ncbi:MAG: M23 family metallopeptidase [Alphaproteobacteria bacterium]|nr:M23 family metallopeptidase [Alphaproteobacteria bacterium]MBV9694175.1 M23 family metallopeptidase [Alphaproteobacteria bacterium]